MEKYNIKNNNELDLLILNNTPSRYQLIQNNNINYFPPKYIKNSNFNVKEYNLNIYNENFI